MENKIGREVVPAWFLLVEGIARIAHEGQLYGDHLPYITHPGAVAGLARAAGYTQFEIQAVCWLHDVLEDSDKFSVDDFRSLGIPDCVIEALILLDTRDTKDPVEKVLRARTSPLSHIGKLYDASHNLISCQQLPDSDPNKARRTARYQSMVDGLSGNAPTPADIDEWLAAA